MISLIDENTLVKGKDLFEKIRGMMSCQVASYLKETNPPKEDVLEAIDYLTYKLTKIEGTRDERINFGARINQLGNYLLTLIK
jgi:hypothetical protein